MNKIIVDKNAVIGKIKPMHCTNNIPSFCNMEETRLFASAGIPYARLHDTFYSLNAHFVDVPKIFPDFSAYENSADSYDFAFTDRLLCDMTECGIKPFYRLGTSIENYRFIKPYDINPPADYLKWAKICEHIIMHYNEGWANGFHIEIEYWELWNEPDNFPDTEDNQMWNADFGEYLRLYEVASNYLKGCFPKLKIGGYGSCGFYEILNTVSTEQAKVSSRTDYFIKCFKSFLEYISSPEHRSPLDFFSWHSYSGVKENIKYAEYCREILNSFGFAAAESHLNEWNPGIENRGTLKDASDICANMLALQGSSLDMLMYYDAKKTSNYCGLLNPIMGKPPFKAFYVFKAFNELYSLKTEIEAKADGDGIYAVAAFNGSAGALLITNNNAEEKEVSVSGIKQPHEALSISSSLNLEPRAISQDITFEPYETLLIKF